MIIFRIALTGVALAWLVDASAIYLQRGVAAQVTALGLSYATPLRQVRQANDDVDDDVDDDGEEDDSEATTQSSAQTKTESTTSTATTKADSSTTTTASGTDDDDNDNDDVSSLSSEVIVGTADPGTSSTMSKTVSPTTSSSSTARSSASTSAPSTTRDSPSTPSLSSKASTSTSSPTSSSTSIPLSASPISTSEPSNTSNGSAKRLGLDIGLGVGLPMLFGAIGLIFFMYLRNQRRSRSEHHERLASFDDRTGSEERLAYNAGEHTAFISPSSSSTPMQQIARRSHDHPADGVSNLPGLPASSRRLSDHGRPTEGFDIPEITVEHPSRERLIPPLELATMK
ncbi:hypothetical protein K431DRAFT_156517 [Polychaeton citri CBS 116435]|uniref:Mid2 domain-containing protein n=1 Tax=Polychaeton citri CBS 116435 TaxID=1314669 RepID=A0A9P4QGB2_9PEZI|nr:hypothetical protein K431DRAFT_156517 [Polychaeton citri CBS 116435]